MYKNNKLLGIILVALFSFFAILKLEAQIAKPGGTSLTTEIWLSADKLQSTLPSNGSTVLNWMDRSPNSVHFGSYNTHRSPIFIYEGLNFQPALEFETTAEDGSGSRDERRTKLASASRYNIDPNKSYYTFYVSTVNAEQSAENASVFSFDGIEYASQGWIKSGPHMWLGEFTSYRVNHTSVADESAIGLAYRSNSGSYPNVSYYNGISQSSTSGRTMRTGTSTARAIIGTSTTAYADHFYGQVQEVIVLSAPVNNPINRKEIAKVNSYLAVKYGISLEGGANYVNSAGENIWTTAKNNGYTNNIFGIGRDDASGLDQKQAAGAKNASFAIYIGDQLEKLNLNNNASLINKTFLLLGSNGERDVTSYLHDAGTEFKEGINTQDINFRQNLVYKAQLTGESSLKINMSTPGRYILVSENDPSFAPQNTRLHPVVDGIAKDVTINDGDYIGFALFETAPGGVFNGLKLWLRADEINSMSLVGGKVDVWKDQTSNSNNYSFGAVTGYSAKTRPTYIACDDKMNYNPALLFDVHSYLAKLGGPMSVDNPDDFISFVVYYSTDYNSTARLYTHGFGSTTPNRTTRHPAMGFAPEKGTGRLFASGSGASINGNLEGYRKYATALHMIHTRKAAAPGGRLLEHDFGGWRDILTTPGSPNFGNNFRMARGSTLGGASISGTASNSGSFQGLISEVFFYEKDLSEEDRNKIRTYLAIKYGITLDADALNPEINSDYILSDGVTSIWSGNSAPNKGFHKNVVGLVRDDTGDMFINKAKSSGDGGIITMMIPGHTECGQGESPGLENDLSALFWGHNSVNGEVVLKGNPDVCGEMDFRAGRMWLVDKTNLPNQEVTIRIGAANDGYFPYNSSSYQVYFLAAKSEEDLKNNKWEVAVPASFIDGQHQLNYTFSEEYTYFTLGVKPMPGTCEAAEFQGIKTLVFNKNTWGNGDLKRSFDLGDNFVVDVATSIASGASFYNKYPRSSSQNSLRQYRKGSTDALMTTEISLSKAAAATFQIYEIDRSGQRYDDVEVYGMCGDTEIRAKLSYSNTPKRSSYEIFGKFAKAKKRPISSYTNNRGKMYVEFEYPVEKIFIKHKATGRDRGSQRIGIGPISFSAPQPLPPTNEDGLVFVKEATPEVLLCEEVLFTYRIVNTNCNPKTVDFADVLPEGMTWVPNSLSIAQEAYPIDDNAYAGTKNLDLKGVVVPGAETLTFRAKAIFSMAATAGTYNTGKGVIEYERIVNDLFVSAKLLSCDRYTSGCEDTKVKALDVPDRPHPVELVNYSPINSCYREDEEITVSISVNNPNPITISNTSLDAIFNEEFTYVPGSLTSSSLTGLSNPEIEDGMLYIEGFNLPQGEHTITFKIKAPTEDGLMEDLDENGNPILVEGEPEIAPLEVAFELFAEADDVCIGGTLSGVSGLIELPYCLSKKAIISNKMVTPIIK